MEMLRGEKELRSRRSWDAKENIREAIETQRTYGAEG